MGRSFTLSIFDHAQLGHTKERQKQPAKHKRMGRSNRPAQWFTTLGLGPQFSRSKTMYHQTPVLAFHQAFGHPVEPRPVMPDFEMRKLRVRLIAEELVEFAQACGVRLVVDTSWPKDQEVVIGESQAGPTDPVEAADGLGDLRYVVEGANLVFGFPGQAIFDEVHRSNMSKLGADGKPIYRLDGKVLKGPSFTVPDIGGILAAARRGTYDLPVS